MKKVLALILVLLMVTACSGCLYKKYLPSTNDDDMTGNMASGFFYENSSEEENKDFDYSSVEVKLEVAYNENNYKESATIYAQDKDGNTVWSRETDEYDVAQLDTFSVIGKKDDKYIYTEGGSIVALDLETGVVLWKNSDFEGYSVRYVFGEKSMYLCGFFGPDFFEVSYDGSTVKRIGTLNDNYWNARKIEDAGDKIAVTFDESYDGKGGTFYVDKNTYSITKK